MQVSAFCCQAQEGGGAKRWGEGGQRGGGGRQRGGWRGAKRWVEGAKRWVEGAKRCGSKEVVATADSGDHLPCPFHSKGWMNMFKFKGWMNMFEFIVCLGN